MIIWLANPELDYQDVILYALKKTYGSDRVITYPDRPRFYEDIPDTDYRSCHYNFKRNLKSSYEDIVAAGERGEIEALIISNPGCPIWEWWNNMKKVKGYRTEWPVIFIDGADGERWQVGENEVDIYFEREFRLVNTLQHELSLYPDYEKDWILNKHAHPPWIHPLPFSIEPAKYPKLEWVNPDLNVFFRGSSGPFRNNKWHRADYMQGIKIPGPSVINMGYSPPTDHQNRNEYYDLARRSKISLNFIGGGNDCKRFWELMGAGAFVLTEDYDQLVEPPFLNGVHLDRFRNKQELQEKIDYYLSHDEERERIRRQGYEFAMANHTCYNRMNYIIDKIREAGFKWPTQLA
jgi:hypothetical protein